MLSVNLFDNESTLEFGVKQRDLWAVPENKVLCIPHMHLNLNIVIKVQWEENEWADELLISLRIYCRENC